jgi:hypothetical protein
MPYHYNWINKCWDEHEQPLGCGPYTVRSSARRFRLLPELIKEIETGDGPTKLYAGMLARHILVSDIDAQLMDEFGKTIADLTEGGKENKTGARTTRATKAA